MRRSIQSLNIFPGIWLSNVPGGKGIGQFELCLAGMKFWTGSVKSFRWNTSASSWKWTCLKVNSLLSRSNGSEDRPWFWILQKNGSSIQLLGGPFEHNFGLEEGEGGGNFYQTNLQKFKCPGGCPRGCWSFGMIDTLLAVMTTYWRLFSLRTELRVRVPPSPPFTGTVAYYTPYAYGKSFWNPWLKNDQIWTLGINQISQLPFAMGAEGTE